MAGGIFTKDTLLDLSVNIIPLFIIGVFVVAFLLYDPWSSSPRPGRIVQFAIMGAMLVGLVVLTYVAAVRIEGDDGE